jgi:hypothetical protein
MNSPLPRSGTAAIPPGLEWAVTGLRRLLEQKGVMTGKWHLSPPQSKGGFCRQHCVMQCHALACLEDALDEVLLQLLVGEVDAQLLERVFLPKG